MKKFFWLGSDSQEKNLWRVLIIGGAVLLWFHLRGIACDFLGIVPADEKPFNP